MSFFDALPVKLGGFAARHALRHPRLYPPVKSLPALPLIAHRGFGSQAFHAGNDSYVENSLEAFKLGAAAGFFGLEFDMHLSADGVPVIHHDPYFIDDLKKKAWLHRLDFSEAQRRFTAARLPSMVELLDLKLPVELFCEIKQPHNPGRLLDILLDIHDNFVLKGNSRLHFISFNGHFLAELARRLAGVQKNLPAERKSRVMHIARYFRFRDFKWAAQAGLDGVLGHHLLADRRRLDYIHKLGLTSGLGMINHPRHLKMTAMKIDCYFTDNAALLDLMPQP